jgi:hypothetical protein
MQAKADSALSDKRRALKLPGLSCQGSGNVDPRAMAMSGIGCQERVGDVDGRASLNGTRAVRNGLFRGAMLSLQTSA